MWRHHPQTRRLRELLDEGVIGRLRLVRAAFSFPLATRPRTSASTASSTAAALMDVGCYCVSGARLVAGAEPERVSAEQVIGGKGVDIALSATLRFPDDVLAQFDCGLAVGHRHEPRGDRRGGLAVPRRPVARPRAGDRADPRRRGRDDRDRPGQPVHPRARELRARRARRGAAAARAPRTRSGRRGRSRRSTRRRSPGRSVRRSRMSVAIGLDVGTSGVKALAVAEDGEIVGRAEVGYGLSTPQPGWAEQDPEDWWRGTQQALEELGADDVAGIGLSGQMHGLVALDAGEQVLRPAILWNDQRTGAECEAIEERIGLAAPDRGHRQPRADGLHRAEAAVAARARARRLRADRAHPAAEGLRPPAPLRRARDRRRRRLRHAALRRRAPALERGGLHGARDRHGLAAARARVARGLGGDERRHPGRRRRRRPGRRGARRRGGRGGRAAVGRARHLGRRVLARCRSSPPTRRRACTRSATPCPRPGTRWA